MKARSMIGGLGDLAGLQAGTKARLSLAESEESEDSQDLSEDAQAIAPPLLTECAAMPQYADYRERTVEEKIRQGVEMIKQAIMDEAWKGVGDDGKVMRDIAPGSPGPWKRVDKLLSKEIYVDRFKPLIRGAEAVIEEFME